MARTGQFGRATRTATSLTNTVIAIAREYQQQRGQNIMDAWQKGGTFEGQKATDKLVLKFWKDRAGGVSKDDPLHDTYQNTVTQLDYGIHESKMTAQYALGKATDQQMVGFYLGWAKKVPKDSEFYRVLQRDAGQYMRSAKAGSEARAKQAKELAYQKAQSDTQSHYEAGAEYIMDTLRRVAQSGNAAHGIGPLIAAPGSGSDFTDFDAGGINPDSGQAIPSDPESILKLLQVIDPQGTAGVHGGLMQPNGEFAGSKEVIFHGDDKKPVTGSDIIAKLAKLDPTFKTGTPLDVAHITSLLDREATGLQERIDRATKTGHMQDAASLGKSKAYVALLNRQVAAWPIEKAYSSLRETYDAVANDPTASPQAIMKAWGAYSAGLNGLANDPTIVADDNLKARLMAEVNGQGGVPTLHESFTGLQGGAYDPASAKDSANTAAHLTFLQDQIDLVTKGAALPDGDPNKVVWTYGKTVNGVFTPDPTGREVGAASATDIDAAGAPGSGTYITVSDPKSGGTISMRVTGTPIKAVATGPDGQPVPATDPNPIGFAYTLPNGATTDIQYGFKGPGGVLVISAKPPFDDRLTMNASKTGGNHFEIDLGSSLNGAYVANPNDPTTPTLDPTKIDLYKEGDAGITGWSVKGVGPATAANPKGTPGTLVFSPYIAATATDGRPPGGLDVTSDFHSLTLSHLMATPEGITVLQNLDHNPAFSTQLQNDANAYAGVQRDPATGAWVPGTGDQNKLNAAMGQVNAASNAKDVVDWVTNQFKTWSRDSTEPYHPGTPGSTVPGPNGMAAPAAPDFAKLATDLVKGTPFEPISNVLFPGSLTPKPPTEVNAATGFTVNVGKALTTPNIGAAVQAVGSVAGQVAGATVKPPVQTGAQASGTVGQTGAQAPKAAIYTGWSGHGAL